MASKLKIKVNGLVHNVTASLDTPLLYVLHNELHLHGPRFGCGLAQCGACSVLLDGKEIRSCVTPVAAVSGKAVTTLEGLPALYAQQRGTAGASPALHPLQQAWIDVQVPHCGYCQNGMMIQAADLLSTTKSPTEILMLAGEELNIDDMSMLVYAHPESWLNSVGGGGGSGGIATRSTVCRAAAASAMKLLLNAASTQLGVPASGLTAKNGVISG